MKYIFECARHEDFSSNGWRLEGQPDFDPLPGMAVAHDILEHFPHGDGSPADELQALGASLWLRDGWHRNGSAGENVGADLPEVMAHVLFEDMTLNTAPLTRPCEADGEITVAIRCMTLEAKYRDGLSKARRYHKDIRAWMRIGYRRAQRRYHGIPRRCLIAIFDEIIERSDKILKYAEIGDRMQISVVLRPDTKVSVRQLTDGERIIKP